MEHSHPNFPELRCAEHKVNTFFLFQFTLRKTLENIFEGFSIFKRIKINNNIMSKGGL